MEDFKIQPNILQPNYYPIDIGQLGLEIGATPQANTPASSPAPLNIVPSSNGSVVNLGSLQSSNFAAGVAGWRIDTNGNLEANDGNFRGDITGAS